MSAARACIFGCEGLRLTPDEVSFFAEADPWGFIIFARNIETPDQVRALTGDLRSAVGRDAPVLVDQEGGRVQRFRAPHWTEWTPALEFCEAAGGQLRDAMHYRGRLIAQELRDVGVDVNCAPILDIATDETHPIIKNRCYGRTAETVAIAGRAMAEGLMAGGVLPVMKHMPGHGRASVDSHAGLPVVDVPRSGLDKTDFAPFRRLSDLPMAMTSHVVYSDIDADAPATLSRAVIDVVRNGIGFDGLLMTDDLSMNALQGTYGERASHALQAGCDVILHCNGLRDQMEPVAANTPRLVGQAEARAAAALSARHRPDDFDAEAARARLAELMGDAA